MKANERKQAAERIDLAKLKEEYSEEVNETYKVPHLDTDRITAYVQVLEDLPVTCVSCKKEFYLVQMIHVGATGLIAKGLYCPHCYDHRFDNA